MCDSKAGKAHAMQKEVYDRKHTLAGSFTAGALVLKKDVTKKHGCGRALGYRWLGHMPSHVALSLTT